MSLQSIINYDTPGNFTYNAAKIEITGGVAQLKIEDYPSQTFVQDYGSDTGFTYDAAKTEFTGGIARQKSQRPANAVLGATYTSSKNANWGDGSLTATDNGTPTLSGGKLVCTGNAQRGVYYDATKANAGSIRFRYTPNYTTSPPNNVDIVYLKSSGTNIDRVGLSHSPSGGSTMRIWLYNSAGVSIYVATTIGGSWAFTNGQEYEFLLTYDATAGVVRLFIDGVVHGTLSPGAWARGSGATRLNIGATSGAYNLADASFNDVVNYDAVLYTSGYTPGYTVAEADYLGDLITLPDFTYSGLETLQSFDTFAVSDSGNPRYILNGLYWNGSAWAVSDNSYGQANSAATVNANIGTHPASDTLAVKAVTNNSNTQMSMDTLTVTYTGRIYPTDDPTITVNSGQLMDGLEAFEAVLTAGGADGIGFILSVNGSDKYWNGSAWVASDGSYAQSNSAADVNTNAAALVLTGETIKVKAVLHSDDGSTTPNIESVTLTYNFFAESPGETLKTIVYGWVYGNDGEPKAGITVAMKLTDPAEVLGDVYLYNKGPAETETDANGYWELSVPRKAGVTFEYLARIGFDSYTVEIEGSVETVSFNDLIVT